MRGLTNFLGAALLTRLRLLLGALALACTVLSAGALAQSPRVFVSARSGVDGGACDLAQPCRTFTYALTQVSAKGEIVAVDSGEYDSVAVNKAVTLQAAPGVYAGITIPATSSVAVNVSAGTSGAVVLRGLTLNALGGQSGQTGVNFNSGTALHIENCTINGFSFYGISIVAAGEFFIKDTTVRDSNYAVFITSTSGTAKVVMENCRLENSLHGLHASANSKVTVRNTVSAGNVSVGFYAAPPSGSTATAELNLENCVSTNNGFGVYANSNSVVRVSNSVITDNSTGVNHFSNGVLLSRGNNTVEGNTTDGTFTGTYGAK
jgi:hypothetical protein